MTRQPSTASQDGCAPPTDVETQRVGALLSTVSTRTLLQTLASLCQQNDDSGLIIAALLERFPPEPGGSDSGRGAERRS